MKLLKRYSNIAFCAALLAVALSVAVLTFPHVNHATAATATPKAAVVLAHGPTFPPNTWCGGCTTCNGCPPGLSGECANKCPAAQFAPSHVATAGRAMPADCKMACCRKKHKDG